MIRRFTYIAAILAVAASAIAPVAVERAEAERPEGRLPLFALANQVPELSTLVTAVKAAKLQGTLASDGPFTVFAPTNEAFAKLDPATLQAVLADKEMLTDILLYHVAVGQLYAADVLAAGTIPMANGQSITVDAANVRVNDSGIIATNIEAKNGVVHLIDNVLLPPTAASQRVSAPGFELNSAFSSATEQKSWGQLKATYEK